MDARTLNRYLRPRADVDALVAALAPLTVAQRRALSGAARRAADPENGRRHDESAVALAVLGCVTGLRQVTSALQWLLTDPGFEARAVQVLRDRAPTWLPDLPRALLDVRDQAVLVRPLIRQLVREELVAPPDHPAYARSLARGLFDGPVEGSVRAALEADPGLLDREVWAMLDGEGSGRELTSVEPWLDGSARMTGRPGPATTPERTWRHALVSLATDGRIDRARLLDQALTVCGGDRSPVDTGWFVTLHDALAPVLAETTARQGTYLRLLAAGPGPVVALAQRELTRLLRAGRLDVPGLAAASAAPLSRSDKATVLAQLRLLQTCAADHADVVAEAVRRALGHPRVDVQERALAVLAALVPDERRRAALLGEHHDDLAPTLQARADPLPPSRPVAAPGPGPVTPIVDADELAEVLAALIEEAADPLDVERVLEAVARLAAARPRAGAAALVRRAADRLGELYPGPWSGEEIRADLAVLVLVWLDGADPGRASRISFGRPDRALVSLSTQRFREVARAVAAGGARPISLPTHDDGSIAADAMRERLRTLPATVPPLRNDVGVAALRLETGGPGQGGILPSAADRLAPARDHRTARALADHLAVLAGYTPRWEPVTGPSGRFPDRLPNATTWQDTGRTAGGDVIGPVLDRRNPLRQLAREAEAGEYAPRFEQVTALWPLLLPHHPELLAAHAHPRLVRALTRNRSGTGPLLDALGRSAERTGPVTCSALVLGIAARNADERVRAADALDRLATHGLLDGAALGGQLRRLLDAGVVTGSRIAGGLADADRAGPAAAGPVCDALQELLPILPGRRDAHLFVDLAAQLATRLGRTVELPAEFTALRSSRSSSAIAAACRRVPVIGGDGT